MFHFIDENLGLTVASLASMQFTKDTGFNKRKLSFMAFLKDTVKNVVHNADI